MMDEVHKFTTIIIGHVSFNEQTNLGMESQHIKMDKVRGNTVRYNK
jgi:hypothetical protein